MSDNIKKMDYAAVDQTIKVMNEAIAQLRESISEVENIAGVMEGGALLGLAGAKLSSGLRKELVKSINNIIEGLEDGVRYVIREREDMRDAEQKSAKLF